MNQHAIVLPKCSRPIAPLTVAVDRMTEPTTVIAAGRRSQDGNSITADNRCLRWNGQPWLPTMGEFHYSRFADGAWRDELLKIKMGGVDIVATYVFWIHHEEIRDQFDWSGDRDLRRFIGLCAEVGLHVVVRCGPWCHGECRNGGLPDWLVDERLRTRSDDPIYMGYVRRLYAQIADQTRGLLFKDGGPVIGIQIENEYDGPAEHLLSLKAIAVQCGLDVPLYTRTGWPELSTPMPVGAMLPLYGGYPDGFWDRSTQTMPPGYGENFLFRITRNDATVATDQLGWREVTDTSGDAHYPYCACEIGGGMMTSYHRRVRIAPGDIAALALVKLGSGNNLQGYYMYHGGTNPEGRLSTLQESQATGYWNDLPIRSYDFQAPLGEYGQVRPHYHSLRRMHLFIRDFGSQLATMPATLPDMLPGSAADTRTVRWCVRSDGNTGFLFISNYQRLQSMPAQHGAQFEIRMAERTVTLPHRPFTIPEDTSCFFPIHLDLGGIELTYATAQPVCRCDEAEQSVFVFAEVDGIPAEFVINGSRTALTRHNGSVSDHDDWYAVTNLETGTDPVIDLRSAEGRLLRIVLLSEQESLECWKADIAGRQRILLSPADVRCDGDRISLESADPSNLHVSVYPPVSLCGQSVLASGGQADGLFQRWDVAMPTKPKVEVHCERVRPAAQPPVARLGSQGVAEPPTEEEFTRSAAVWRIVAPGIDPNSNARLRIRYVGDIARVYAGDRLVTDNFYNGDAFEIGSCATLLRDGILLHILPSNPDARIYQPGTTVNSAIGDEPQIDLVESYSAALTAPQKGEQR